MSRPATRATVLGDITKITACELLARRSIGLSLEPQRQPRARKKARARCLEFLRATRGGRAEREGREAISRGWFRILVMRLAASGLEGGGGGAAAARRAPMAPRRPRWRRAAGPSAPPLGRDAPASFGTRRFESRAARAGYPPAPAPARRCGAACYRFGVPSPRRPPRDTISHLSELAQAPRRRVLRLRRASRK